MTEEMRSRLLGMMMARVSRGVFPQREPVAFLYGHVAKEGETVTHTINGVDYVGVVAPDIFSVWTPELQAERPYVYVYNQMAGTGFHLELSEEPAYWEENRLGITGYSFQCPTRPITYYCKTGGTLWERLPDADYARMEIANSIGGNTKLYWANKDIPNPGGEGLYIPYSDPIPIYE